jgi:hypothetical protein
MVADLTLGGRVGTKGLMFVPYYARSPRAFIANYSSWKEYDSSGIIAEVACSLLSHESLHLAINRFSYTASERLDNLFGRSDSWQCYAHGLGDFKFAKYPRLRNKFKNAKKARQPKRHKLSENAIST